MADGFGTGGGVVSAVDHRLAQAGLIAPQTSTLAVRTGVLIAPGATALVTGTSATGTMTVAVAAHHWVSTRGTADGVYLGTVEAATTVTISAAPGSNSRIDVIYVKQNDAGSTISPDGSTAMVVDKATGTAAVSPTKPAIPTGALELATVTVAVGATSTNGAGVTISNTALLTAARGARIHVRSQADRDALTAFAGLEVYRIDLGTVELYAGTSWLTVARRNVFTTMPFAGSWISYGGFVPATYSRDMDGFIQLDGVARSSASLSTAVSGNNIANLPPPLGRYLFSIPDDFGDVQFVFLETSGQLNTSTLSPMGRGLPLSAIRYRPAT